MALPFSTSSRCLSLEPKPKLKLEEKERKVWRKYSGGVGCGWWKGGDDVGRERWNAMEAKPIA